MATITDFTIVCGLSRNGGWDGAKETDWYKLGIPVQAQDIWEFQFECLHKAGDPNAIVVGSFVMYDTKGVYVGTTPGPITNLTDSTAWQRYAFQYQFSGPRYVFPAIWWHGTTALNARYLAGVQVANVRGYGGSGSGGLIVVQPDLFLTLGTSDPTKVLAGTHASLGPPDNLPRTVGS